MIRKLESETGIKTKEEIHALGVEAIFLLRRVVWELSDGAEFSGNKVTDATYDRAQEIVQEARI